MKTKRALDGIILVVVATTSFECSQISEAESTTQPVETGSVIFIHPDGTTASHWTAARIFHYGPDGDLHWDRLPAVAVYRGHVLDTLTATSNAGGTIHAYGVKVHANAYGTDGTNPIVDSLGHSRSVMRQAIAAGFGVGVVNSGSNTEPGTGCFLASVEHRSNHDSIAQQLIESGADVIMGGGEQWFLPAGVEGRHGSGKRADGLDLIKEARKRGYYVVFTADELLALPHDATKVLGLFGAKHTFNDQTEEDLAEKQLPAYQQQAPTLAQMTRAAILILRSRAMPFLLVVEEEGTDNFANRNNAAGMFEALRRADDAIGVARADSAKHGDTLVITAADSDAGGMKLIGIKVTNGQVPDKVTARDQNGAPLDGRHGTETAPFMAAPDRAGRSLPFAIAWATLSDCSGGVLARAEGLNAELVHGSLDNTDLTRLIRLTLFDTPR